MLRPKYRKAFMKKYNEVLETLYYMKHSPLHYKVWEAIGDYEDAGRSLKRAIFVAVEDCSHLLNELLELLWGD